MLAASMPDSFHARLSIRVKGKSARREYLVYAAREELSRAIGTRRSTWPIPTIHCVIANAGPSKGHTMGWGICARFSF